MKSSQISRELLYSWFQLRSSNLMCIAFPIVTFSGETTHTPQTGKTELLLQAYRLVHLLPVDVLP